MTILEAIKKIDEYKDNHYSEDQKVAWLSELDGQIKAGILDTHASRQYQTVFHRYTVSTPKETVLLVKAPFDDIYIRWLEAKICYADNDFDGYTAASTLYNRIYNEYESYYNRTHATRKHGKRFIF